MRWRSVTVIAALMLSFTANTQLSAQHSQTVQEGSLPSGVVRWAPVVGQKLEYQVGISTTFSLIVNGQALPAPNPAPMYFRVLESVIGKDKDGVSRYDMAVVEASNGPQTPVEVTKRFTDYFRGGHVIVSYGDRGNLLSASLLSGANLDGTAGEALLGLIGDNLVYSANILPEGAVMAGSTWSCDLPLKQGARSPIVIRYTLDSITGDLIRVTGKIDQDFDLAQQPAFAQVIANLDPGSPQPTGKIIGRYEFLFRRAGSVIESANYDANLRLQGPMKVKGESCVLDMSLRSRQSRVLSEIGR
ncbi:MAG: hypothetical protein H6Q00_390 [Holophagaceae bacterium]|nr:hypothetical protein [Holophagaceae bacterium]